MRIAMVSTCALATPPKAYGGTELMVAELAKGLTNLGHEVTLFATGDSQPLGTLKHLVPEPVWPPDNLAEMRHAAFAWHCIAHASAPFDVVHVHHAAAIPFQPLTQLPTALTVHHARDEALVSHYRCYPDVAYVAISQRQATQAPEISFARTIYHGLDPALYPAGDGQGGYAAFLGRFAPEKAPHIAIDAALKANTQILLAGSAQEVARDYFAREMLPRLSSQNHQVSWVGEVSHAPKLKLLQGARALLFPVTWEEPFGLAMIEAMLVGTPVIAFANGSPCEVIDEGVTGFLVRDKEEMAARLTQLDGFDRARCRARAIERWSFIRMARDYADLYREMLSPRKRAEACGQIVSIDHATAAWAERSAQRHVSGTRHEGVKGDA